MPFLLPNQGKAGVGLLVVTDDSVTGALHFLLLQLSPPPPSSLASIQEAQLMLTTGSTRLAVSRGQQTWYHSTCYI